MRFFFLLLSFSIVASKCGDSAPVFDGKKCSNLDVLDCDDESRCEWLNNNCVDRCAYYSNPDTDNSAVCHSLGCEWNPDGGKCIRDCALVTFGAGSCYTEGCYQDPNGVETCVSGAKLKCEDFSGASESKAKQCRNFAYEACVWITNVGVKGECKPKADTTCSDFTANSDVFYGNQSECFDFGCAWVPGNVSGGTCLERSEVQCSDYTVNTTDTLNKSKFACVEFGCDWVKNSLLPGGTCQEKT